MNQFGIKLPSGATAHVSKDVKPETIQALDEMMQADIRREYMDAYKQYRRTQIAEMADWHPEFDMASVSISQPDKDAGSPKAGDKIARNPANHDDKWLVSKNYFEANFEAL